MFEHFTSVEEIFSYKLGSALTMERDSLEMLGDLEKTAVRRELKDLFVEHAHETRQQIENLKQCFMLLGEDVNDSPSPATKGLAKEAKSTTGKADESLVDAVVLAGALETEHYETAVYETLIIHAQARGASDVVELLRQNLEQEKAAIEKIREATQAIARDGIAILDTRSAAGEPRTDDGETVPTTTTGVPPFLPPASI